MRTKIRIKKKRSENQMGFLHENPNPVLKVWEGKWIGWN
jgi:hypothetical protein